MRPRAAQKCRLMADRLTPEERSAIMRRIRRQDTGPELAVRRLLHRMGYRFRLHAAELPGSPDVAFRPRKAVVFVHGCFWHGHHCRWSKPVQSNGAYWAEKIERNRKRDAAVEEALRSKGWRTAVVWECELKDLESLASMLRLFLDDGEKPAG